MEKFLVNRVVTKELVDEVFGGMLGRNGGWRQSLMPEYIDNVLAEVLKYASDKHDYCLLRKETIRKMKEYDPVLFKRDI